MTYFLVGISKSFKMVDLSNTRKLVLLILLIVVLIAVYNGVEARGGGRGGGRGGSRGGSRGRSRGGSRSSSSRVRAAITRYKGPRYSKGSWKTAAAVGTLWGLSSYKRRSRYKSHPNREPQVCFNAVNPRMGTYGYFICPEEGQPDNYDYCCGEEGEQRCCGFFDDGGRVAGVVIGVIAFCVAVGIGIFCLCKYCKGRQRQTGGKVLENRDQATWNKKEQMPLYTANDSVNLGPSNTYPSTTEHQVQPSPMGYTSSDGLPYSTNPAAVAGYGPPTQYPSQPYPVPPFTSTDEKVPPYSSDPYAAGPGIGFTYSDPNAPPGTQGYAPTGVQPYPPAPPPPYPNN